MRYNIMFFQINDSSLIIVINNFVACQTDGGPETNKPCVFPFRYKGVEYKSCANIRNNGIKWCSTEVDSNQNYVGKWGNCGEGCIMGK